MKEFPFEVCCVRFECRGLIEWFLRAPDWKIAFYGPSAVVFTRKNIPLVGGSTWVGTGIGEIKSLRQALIVFNFAATIRDWNSTNKILTHM